VRAPHAHHQQGRIHNADAGTIHAAIDAAVAAQRDWSQATLAERAAVFLKAADLLAARGARG
jgi:1-pyrroline-5-carboxylate dehydrogenase